MNMRVAKCGHSLPTHTGSQRKLCDDCRESEGLPRRDWVVGCAWCGEWFRAAHPRQRYCTDECQRAPIKAQRSERIEATRVHKNCGTCGTSLTGRSRKAKYCTIRCADVARGQRLPAPLPLRICGLPDCDVQFQPNREGTRCCSEAHGRQLWKIEHPDYQSPYTDARRDSYHRRRARKAKAATGRPVLLSEIRVRDKNRCHICGERVSARPYPHPLSASMDHVVPLSKGGAHDPDNVKLAHLRCNVRKGDGGGNEQLLLIG